MSQYASPSRHAFDLQGLTCQTQAWGIHEIGRREENQDCIYPSLTASQGPVDSPIYMVCDGVGGAAHGQQASRIVCETFASFQSRQPFHAHQDIIQAIRLAEQYLTNHVAIHPEASGMATTFTFLAFNDDEALIAFAGDSRIYHFRDGEIMYRTSDHSLVQGLINEKIISEEEARKHPHRNVISRAVMGEHQPVDPEIHSISDLREGDVFLLCSDGILESVDDELMGRFLKEQDVTDETRIERIRQMCRRGSKDNYSAWLVRILAVRAEPHQVPARRSFFQRATDWMDTPVFLRVVLVLIALEILFLFLASR